MEVQFTEEIALLQLGAGAAFQGEGILAITKALFAVGRRLCRRLPGRAGVSHLLDVMVQAKPYLDTALGVHVEACANEATQPQPC